MQSAMATVRLCNHKDEASKNVALHCAYPAVEACGGAQSLPLLCITQGFKDTEAAGGQEEQAGGQGGSCCAGRAQQVQRQCGASQGPRRQLATQQCTTHNDSLLCGVLYDCRIIMKVSYQHCAHRQHAHGPVYEYPDQCILGMHIHTVGKCVVCDAGKSRTKLQRRPSTQALDERRAALVATARLRTLGSPKVDYAKLAAAFLPAYSQPCCLNTWPSTWWVSA
jgi:hypothetical protein